MASVTWDGITVDFDNLAGYAWFNNTVAVNSVTYPLLQGYMVAGLREMDTAITGVGSTLTATSSTSETIGTGSKSLTIQTGKGFSSGNPILVTNTGTPANYMAATVTSYNTDTGALAFNATATGGSGTLSAWTVSISGVTGATGANGDMTGPGSSTDNVWPRFDGTDGSTLQNGTWSEDDSGNVTAGGTLDMDDNALTVDAVSFNEAGQVRTQVLGGIVADRSFDETSQPVVSMTVATDLNLDFETPNSNHLYSITLYIKQDTTAGRVVTIRDGSNVEATWIGDEPDWAAQVTDQITRVSVFYGLDDSTTVLYATEF